MTRYTSIRSALRFIPRNLYDRSTDLDFLTWMLDGFRQLDLPVTYDSKIKFIEIINNRAELPKDIKEIKLLTYMFKNPDQNDVDSLTGCITNPVETTTTESDTNNICQYTLAYKQFLDSKYYNNNFMPLQYKGNYADSILCTKCPNRFSPCQNYFTVDKNNILHTNIKDGFLCIDYFTEMKDEAGDFLIPDLTELKQYLAYYAMAKHWEERAMVKEQSADRIAQDLYIKAEIFFKKIRGILIMRGINPNDITNMQFDGYNQWIKIPERYVFAR